jgi:hypothetical protein
MSIIFRRKKVKCFLLLSTLVGGLTTTIHGQDVGLDWARHFGGSQTEYFGDFDTDSAGNIYSVGLFEGTADFDPGPGTFNMICSGVGDGYILKLDADGNFIWVKKIGGTGDDYAKDIVIDSSGNILVSGLFSNTVDFDPGAGIFNMTSPSGLSFYLCKLDPDGNFLWAQKFGKGSFANLPSIDIDDANCSYVTAEFSVVTDFDPGVGIFNLVPVEDFDIFVLKFNASGDFIWAKQIGGTLNQNAHHLKLDAVNNILVVGGFNGTADFDPGIGVHNFSSANGNPYILKLDSAGNFIWAQEFAGVVGGYCGSVFTDENANVYTTGLFQNVIDFDPGIGVFDMTSGTGVGAFVVKLDLAGDLVWAKCLVANLAGIEAVIGHDIFVDDAENVYSAGRFSDTTDFDPGPGVMNLIPGVSVGYGSGYYIKLDATGNFVWAKQIKRTGHMARIMLDINENILLGGDFDNTSDFDVSASVQNETSFGESDCFIVKLKECEATNSVITETVCSSYLSPSGNSLWTTSGIYTEVIGNVNGCDSVITINLTVNNADTSVIQSGFVLTANASSATYQWIDCDNGFIPLPGENSADFNAFLNGNYSVVVTQNGCQDTSACFLIEGLEIIEGNFDGDICIYPNPANDKLFISHTGPSEYLEVFSLTGEKVIAVQLNSGNDVIDISALSDGVYFYRFCGAIGKFVKK